jgi:hypothetical protein
MLSHIDRITQFGLRCIAVIFPRPPRQLLFSAFSAFCFPPFLENHICAKRAMFRNGYAVREMFSIARFRA